MASKKKSTKKKPVVRPVTSKKVIRPTGRPTKYSKQIADEICFRLSNGESVRTICRDEHMPVVSTIFYWIEHEETAPGFSEHYAKAKEMMIECHAAEIVEIADDSTNDFYEKKLKNGDVAVVGDTEMVNRSRLRVDTRKWVCERLAPKKYAPRAEVKHTGAVLTANVDVEGKTPEELIRILNGN